MKTAMGEKDCEGEVGVTAEALDLLGEGEVGIDEQKKD